MQFQLASGLSSPQRLTPSRVGTSSPVAPRSRRSVRVANIAQQTAPSVVESVEEAGTSSRLNIIAKSKWKNGIPPVMGAHLMPSGVVAPISTSKGVERTPFLFYYPEGDVNVTIEQFGTPSAAASGLADLVADASAKAIAAKGSFTVALSGGSLVTTLTALLDNNGIEFSKWHIFFVDERNVSHSSEDSNYKAANDALLSKAGIPTDQVFAIHEGLSVKDAAINYAGRLLGLDTKVMPKTANSIPQFDMILLGVGPDGHVASLFPNRKQTADKTNLVLPVENSPKPPAERITFTMPLINAAKDVVVVAIGAGKAEIVQRVLEVQALPGALPAQLVRPADGKLTWVLDAAAAADLRPGQWQQSKSHPRSHV